MRIKHSAKQTGMPNIGEILGTLNTSPFNFPFTVATHKRSREQYGACEHGNTVATHKRSSEQHGTWGHENVRIFWNLYTHQQIPVRNDVKICFNIHPWPRHVCCMLEVVCYHYVMGTMVSITRNRKTHFPQDMLFTQRYMLND